MKASVKLERKKMDHPTKGRASVKCANITSVDA